MNRTARLAVVGGLAALVALLLLAPAAFGREDPPPPREDGPTASRAIARALETKLSLDFSDTPFTDVVSFLRKASGINIVIDPLFPWGRKAEESFMVQLRVKDIPLKDVLKLITSLKGLAFRELHDVVFIGRTKDIDGYAKLTWGQDAPGNAKDPAPGEARPHWSDFTSEKVPLLFVDTPLGKALEFLGKSTKSRMILTQAARILASRNRISFEADGLRADKALKLMLQSFGLDFRWMSGASWITVRGEPETPEIARGLDAKIAAKLQDLTLEEALAKLAVQARVNIVPGPAAAQISKERGASVTMFMGPVPLRHTLQMLTAFQMLDFICIHGVVWVDTPENILAFRSLEWFGDGGAKAPTGRAGEILKAMRDKKISPQFSGMPLAKVKDYFEKTLGAPLSFEKGADLDAPVALRLKDVSMENALRLVLMPLGLEYRVEKKRIVISKR